MSQYLTHPDEWHVLLGTHRHGSDVRGVDKQRAVVVDIHHRHVDHSLSQHLHAVAVNVFSLQQQLLVHMLFIKISFPNKYYQFIHTLGETPVRSYLSCFVPV